MKISVIVPIYNVQDQLKNSLNSLLKQSFNNFEVIMVNDGSTDSSQKIAQKFDERDARFRLYTTQNQGLAVARNEGLKYIHGEIVFFMDADDQIAPNLFDAIIKRFELNPELDVIHFSYSEIDHSLTKINKSKLESFESIAGKEALVKLMDVKLQPTAWAYISRRKVIENNNLRFSKGRLFEDENFNAKLLSNAKQVGIMKFESGPYYYLVEKRENKLMYQIMQHKNMVQFNDRLFITNDEYMYLDENKSVNTTYLNRWYLTKLIWIYNYYFSDLHNAHSEDFKKLKKKISKEYSQNKGNLLLRQKVQYLKVKNVPFYYTMQLVKQVADIFRQKSKKL